MKIIYYCDWFKEYTASLATAVHLKSNEVTLITREQSPEFNQRRNDEIFVQDSLVKNGIDLYLLKGKYSSFKSIIDVIKIYRKKKKEGYKYFHLQQTGDPRFLWIAFCMPTILTLHEPKKRNGVVRGTDVFRKFISDIISKGYRKYAKIIIVHTEESLNGLTKSEKKKATVIPHGVKILSESTLIQSNTILFFGRAAAYKGLETLIDAMEIVWKSIPNARLRILASPGDFINEKQLDERIEASWNGYSNEQLEVELSKSRIVCMPYLSAAGSGVGAQAYGAGKTIVASDLDGLRDLVEFKELLVPPGDEKKLAQALITTLNKDYSSPKIDLNKTWPVVAERHINIYKTLN